MLGIILFGASCTFKKGEIPIVPDNCKAGHTGNVSVYVFMKHEEHQIGNLKNYRDTVYIKYNAVTSPGTEPTDYDSTFIGDYPSDFVLIPNLSCGNYFIYEVGFNNIHSERATGEMVLKVEHNDGVMNVTIEGSE